MFKLLLAGVATFGLAGVSAEPRLRQELGRKEFEEISMGLAEGFGLNLIDFR